MDIINHKGVKVFSGNNEDFFSWFNAVEARIFATGINIEKVKKKSKEDGIIYSFLLSVTEGHPVLILNQINDKSGVEGLQLLQQRYIPATEDAIAKLKQDLRNSTWTASDNVDSFTGRLLVVVQKLERLGVSTDVKEIQSILATSLPQQFDLAMRFIRRTTPAMSFHKIVAELLEEERLHQRRHETVGTTST